MSRALFDLHEVLWVLFLAASLSMVAGFHRLAAVMVERGTLTNRQRWRFTISASTILTIVGLSILGAQLWTGVRNPLCIGVVPGTEHIATASGWWIASLLAGLVLWVWWGQGFALVVQLAPVLLHGPRTARTYSRRQVQLAVLAAVGACVVGGVVLDSPPPSDRCGPDSELRFQWRLEMPKVAPREA